MGTDSEIASLENDSDVNDTTNAKHMNATIQSLTHALPRKNTQSSAALSKRSNLTSVNH